MEKDFLFLCHEFNSGYMRGIEWSLRAFADMEPVRVFLQTQAVIKFALQLASTLENAECK